MKIYCFFLFIACFSLQVGCSFNNPKCKGARYLCGESNAPSVCVNVSDYQQKVHLLQPCPSGTYCPIASNFTNKTISCIPDVSTNKILPGESCSTNQDCYSVNCLNGFCKGANVDESCSNHSDCEPGLFCNQSHCSKQVAFGENCTSSYECTNNCACSLGKCAYYYSLDDGIASDNIETCASGYIINNTCVESRRSLLAGIPCSSDSDCVLINSTGQTVGYSECSCGYNGGGYSYCALVEGDDEFINVKNSFQFLLLRSFNCHTLLRFGPCKYIYNDEYLDYIKAVKKYQMYPQLVFNDQCIKQIYTVDYWELSEGILQISWIFIVFLLNNLFLLS